ncbi:MAG: hypothetical protein AAAB35_03145, partial [Phyllobacterium sp.]|uniref:hypothetical protein n=1 Tax=Phyllobacterium sp. TaxID=1871046 RepID=UPI0030F10448
VGCEALGHGAADAILDKSKAATDLATLAPYLRIPGRNVRRLLDVPLHYQHARQMSEQHKLKVQEKVQGKTPSLQKII